MSYNVALYRLDAQIHHINSKSDDTNLIAGLKLFSYFVPCCGRSCRSITWAACSMECSCIQLCRLCCCRWVFTMSAETPGGAQREPAVCKHHLNRCDQEVVLIILSGCRVRLTAFRMQFPYVKYDRVTRAMAT